MKYHYTSIRLKQNKQMNKQTKDSGDTNCWWCGATGISIPCLWKWKMVRLLLEDSVAVSYKAKQSSHRIQQLCF